VVLLFLFRFLHLASGQHEQAYSALDTTETSLLESEERFRQMADNIQEIFWMIDAETRKDPLRNPAYETITGRTRAALKEDPLSYEEILCKLEQPSPVRRPCVDQVRKLAAGSLLGSAVSLRLFRPIAMRWGRNSESYAWKCGDLERAFSARGIASPIREFPR
jgi:PAS domain-containing protein